MKLMNSGRSSWVLAAVSGAAISLAAVVFVAGCGSDGGISPPPVNTQSLQSALPSLVVTGVHTPVNFVQGPMPTGSAPAPVVSPAVLSGAPGQTVNLEIDSAPADSILVGQQGTFGYYSLDVSGQTPPIDFINDSRQGAAGSPLYEIGVQIPTTATRSQVPLNIVTVTAGVASAPAQVTVRIIPVF